MDNAWRDRLLLLMLCGAWLHGGFVGMNGGEVLDLFDDAGLHVAHAGPSRGLLVLNALAALAMVLFAGKARRMGALWLGLISVLAAVMVFRFWQQDATGFQIHLQGFLGMIGYAAAFFLVATGQLAAGEEPRS